MSSSHTLLKYTRLIHLYLGVFTAPALLFFAFTGALQTFSLHETTRGSSYKPPAWAVTLGQIHKKQTPVVPVRKLPPPDKPADRPDKPNDKPSDKPTTDKSPSAPSPNAPPKSPEAPTQKPHNALPLKIFFLVVAIGLFVSTLTGLYMSYKYIRNRTLITVILIAGIVIPILLTIL
jgi:outer membrane biosynthesis protein TonB